MKDYLAQSLQAFSVTGKHVALSIGAPPWSQEMLIQHGASLDQTAPPFDAIFLLHTLKTLPNGQDLKVLTLAKTLLKPNGLLYLSLPIGIEKITPDSYRVYGEKQMKILFKDWRPTGYFGYSYEDLTKDPTPIHEPIFVLKAK